MNYDAFEREVLGYGQRMSCRAEHRRVMHPLMAAGDSPTGYPARPLRLHLAVALRSLADHLDTRSAGLA